MPNLSFMKPLFFDLDGTLIDSKLDLANSVNAALSHFNLQTLDNETIYGFVGNGVKQLLVDCLKQNNKLNILDEFYMYFLEHYQDHLLDNTHPYKGIVDVLDELRHRYDMFVVTNKSEMFAQKILKELKLSDYFKDIAGGDSYEHKKPHPEPVLRLKERYGLNIDKSFVVGDSENDILLAKALNLRIIWASYGFRDMEILKTYKVDFVINTPKEILDIV